MSSKLRPYLRSIYRTLVIWICEAFGLLLLIHFIPGLSVNSVYDPTNDVRLSNVGDLDLRGLWPPPPDTLYSRTQRQQRLRPHQRRAFAELIGSHGGLDVTQCKPFVLCPAEWGLDQQEIVGAEKLHQLFKSRLHSVQEKP
ncbi:MAG: hypothetical protein ABSD89_03480 [Halobacteriota archaeon]